MNVLEFIATMWGITCAAALISVAVTKGHVRRMRELELEHEDSDVRKGQQMVASAVTPPPPPRPPSRGSYEGRS